MRVMVLPVILFSLLSLSRCSNVEKSEGNTADAYGEYEIAEPGNSKARSGSVLHVVEIIQMKFVPEVLNIKKGDTVVWINKDLVQHDVTETTKNLWTSLPMAAGASWKKQITDSQQYHCSLHMVMTGRIVVDGNDVAFVDTMPRITLCESKIVPPEPTKK